MRKPPFAIRFERSNPDDTMGRSLGISKKREQAIFKAMQKICDELSDDELENWFDRLYEKISDICREPEELFLVAWLAGVACSEEMHATKSKRKKK